MNDFDLIGIVNYIVHRDTIACYIKKQIKKFSKKKVYELCFYCLNIDLISSSSVIFSAVSLLSEPNSLLSMSGSDLLLNELVKNFGAFIFIF